jgi:hypothetical protein
MIFVIIADAGLYLSLDNTSLVPVYQKRRPTTRSASDRGNYVRGSDFHKP